MSTAAEHVREAFFRLPENERHQLIDELWEHESASRFDLSPEHIGELRARVADSEVNPEKGSSWEELKAELQAQLKP